VYYESRDVGHESFSAGSVIILSHALVPLAVGFFRDTVQKISVPVNVVFCELTFLNDIIKSHK
jgi:hypothetical protein